MDYIIADKDDLKCDLEEEDEENEPNLIEDYEYILEVEIDDPPEILKSHINMLKGKMFFEFGKYKEAIEFST